MHDAMRRLRREALLDVDAPFPSDGWLAPSEVSLDGDALRFSAESSPRRRFPADGMLTAFLRLELAAPAEIAAFAREWGRLHLCTHGLPHTHRLHLPGMRIPSSTYLPPLVAQPGSSLAAELQDLGMDEDLPYPERVLAARDWWGDAEPLAGWRFLAGRMAGVYEAAAVLDIGESPSASTWERAGGPETLMVIERFEIRDPSALRGFVLGLVNGLLALTMPAIRLVPSGLTVGGDGLAAALAVQLTMGVARQDTDFLPCMEAGCTFRARRPRRGATPYCEFHLSHGVRRRDEQRRRRERAYERQRKDLGLR
ncbi:MAG: hypothetical protein C0498_10735 [Anaerolinea sp.]|nr:hypothetical protein [Anaerolinea sp.]